MRPLFRTLLISMCLGVAMLPAVASGAVNLLANPGFEDAGGSYDGWFTFGNGPQMSTPDTDNIFRPGGAAAAKIFGEFSNCPDFPVFDVGGFGQAFTPTPGIAYELSGYSYIDTSDLIPGASTCDGNRLLAQVAFFDAAVGGTVIQSNEVDIGDYSTALDEWLPFSFSTAATPAGAMRVEALFLFLQPGCDTGSVFVDDASFCEVTPLAEINLLSNPSFSSGLTDWSPFGNAFPDARPFATRTPIGSAKLFGTFVEGNDSGIIQNVPATAGANYRLDVYSLHTCVESPNLPVDNENVGLARIVFRDGAAMEIEAVDVEILAGGAAPLGTWTRHGVLATAPVGAVSMDVFVLFVQPPSLPDGAMWVDDIVLQEVEPIGVADAGIPAPTAHVLHQNVPNPFNPSTRIGFELLRGGSVDLSVYDITGRLIAQVFEGDLPSGSHSFTWNGSTTAGAQAAAGQYRYVLNTPDGRSQRSMVLLK